jgi:Dockerin type I domain
LAALSAVAVAIVAAGALVWLGGHTRLAARNEDLNGDGVVDVLDAFALARELQQGQTPRPQLDLNGDGVVDERDVQILAARAVSLETGGGS